MSSGRIHHDELDPDDPLGSIAGRGWFDCLAGSSLLAGLCRARGIPARVVNGFTLYEMIPSNHFWTEVLLPPFGWVPFDLGSWELAAGDRDDRRWSEHYFGRLDADDVPEIPPADPRPARCAVSPSVVLAPGRPRRRAGDYLS